MQGNQFNPTWIKHIL